MKKIFTLLSVLSASGACLWAQTPNSGFETWTTTGFPSYAAATNWDSPNSQTAITGIFVCVKATAAADVHSGSTAVKLITKNVLATDAPGIVTTGTLPTAQGSPITGGVAYTLRPDSIVGWYKYTSVSGDNGFFAFDLFGAGGNTDTVGIGSFATPAATVGVWTRFSAPIIYKSANPVVTCLWIACSSNNGTAAKVGSTLFADDLAVVFSPTTGLAEVPLMNVTVGPNPTTDHIVISNASGSNVIFTLSDMTGRNVALENISGDINSVSVSGLPQGLYMYAITDQNKEAIRSGKLLICR